RCAFEMRHGFLNLAQWENRHAPIPLGVGVVPRQLHGLREMRNCRGRILQRQVCFSESELGAGIIGPKLHHRLEMRQRLSWTSDLRQGEAEAGARVDVLRCRRDGPLERRGSLPELLTL